MCGLIRRDWPLMPYTVDRVGVACRCPAGERRYVRLMLAKRQAFPDAFPVARPLAYDLVPYPLSVFISAPATQAIDWVVAEVACAQLHEYAVLGEGSS